MVPPCASLFRDLVFYVDFMLNLAHFGLPFGSPWLTFGSLWLPFGSLLAPFGSLLAHFWCPLAHFWCPFLHFCSPREPFSHFCCVLSSFFVPFGIFHENIVQNHENLILGQSSRIFPKRIERTPTESTSSLVTHPSRARSGTFAAGNLDQ